MVGKQLTKKQKEMLERDYEDIKTFIDNLVFQYERADTEERKLQVIASLMRYGRIAGNLLDEYKIRIV